MRTVTGKDRVNWSALREQPGVEGVFPSLVVDLLIALGFSRESPTEPGQDFSIPNLVVMHGHGQRIIVALWDNQHPLSALQTQNLLQRSISAAAEVAATSAILVTRLALPDDVTRLIDKYNCAPSKNITIGCIDHGMLDCLLVCLPKVYNRHFRERLPVWTEDLDCNKIRNGGIICSVACSTKLLNPDSNLEVRVKNSGRSAANLSIEVRDGDTYSLPLGAFGSCTLSLPADFSNLPEWPEVTVSDIATGERLAVESSLTGSPKLRVDHIYADPLRWTDEVLSAVENHRIVFIAGGPGAGKSRLIKEALKNGFNKSISWVDLSLGAYGTTLIDHLISIALGVDGTCLPLHPDTMLEDSLHELGCDDIEAISIVNHLRRAKDANEARLLVNAVIRAIEARQADHLLVIDNVHRVRHLDAELLLRLISSSRIRLIATLRDQEIEDSQFMELFTHPNLEQSEDAFVLRLGDSSVHTLLEHFIEASTLNQSTARFLRPLCHSENLQEFMLTLKSLKARRVIVQNAEGMIAISQEGKQLAASDYRTILREFLAGITNTQQEREDATRVLELGAVYGSSFHIGFLESQLTNGESGALSHERFEAVLDLLEEVALIEPENIVEELYRFDHELTHDVVYNSINARQRRRHHRSVIHYLEATGADNDANAATLSRHYKFSGDLEKAANFAQAYAKYVGLRGGLVEGLEWCEKSLKYLDQLRESTRLNVDDSRLYALEAAGLDDLIKFKYAVSGSDSTYDDIRKLDVLMLLYPASRASERLRLLGRASFYFARHFNLAGDYDKASHYMQKALDALEEAESPADFGEALCRASTIEKNRGRFDQAFEYAEQAIDCFQEISQHEGLSIAYRMKGAAHLESGNLPETVTWWRKSREVVRGVGAEKSLCGAQVDYAYILALSQPDLIEVGDELQRGLDLARRLEMRPDEIRSLINLSNWLFFHSNTDENWRSFTDRANVLADEESSNDYLRMLVSFSMINFSIDDGFHHQRLESLVSTRLESFDPGTAIGDNRLLNMISYLHSKGSTLVGRHVKLYPSKLSAPSDLTLLSSSQEIYRRESRFITLY